MKAPEWKITHPIKSSNLPVLVDVQGPDSMT